MDSVQTPAQESSLLDRFLPTTTAADHSEDAGISVSEIRAMLYRQRKFIFPMVLAGPLLAFGVTWMMPKIYEGTVSVKIDNERAKIIEGQDLNPAIAANDTGRYLATQSKIVASRAIAVQVAEELNLAKDNQFIQSMGESPVDENLPQKDRAAARKEQAIQLLQAKVKMDSPTDSRIAAITFRSRSPQLAALIANTYAAKYVGQNILERFEMNTYANKVLTTQVAETQKQLRATEEKAIEYARSNHLIDIGDASSGADNGSGGGKDTGNSRSVVTANLVSINDAFIKAKADRVSAEQRWRTAQGSPALDLPEARSHPTLQALLANRATAAAKVAQLRKRYAPNRAEVQEAQAELSATDAEIAAISQNIKNSIKNEYLDSSRTEIELSKERSDLSAASLSEQEKRVQLNMIVRDADTLRKQLGDLLTRVNQVAAAADINTNNITIIDRAEVPDTPVSPKLMLNLLVGVVAGLAFALSAALVRELFDETLQRPEDVEGKLKLPLLGVVPWTQDNVLEALADAKSGMNEAYYSARTSTDYASGGKIKKVLMVTSSSPSEGKSTTAFALAHDFANADRSVLIIDADTRVPSQHRFFGIKRKHAGLTDCLMHDMAIEDAVVQTNTPGLAFLPLGARPANPVHLLSSEIVGPFFEKLRERYDVIIVDAPPVMGLADAPLLARLVDAVIFVTEAGRAHNGQAKIAIRRLRDNGARILGVVMTKFNPIESGYGDSRYQYYYYKYNYGRAQREGSTPAA